MAGHVRLDDRGCLDAHGRVDGRDHLDGRTHLLVDSRSRLVGVLRRVLRYTWGGWLMGLVTAVANE